MTPTPATADPRLATGPGAAFDAGTMAMPNAVRVLLWCGPKHSQPAAARRPQPLLSNTPAVLAQAESEHRLANILQMVMCNLQQATRGADAVARTAMLAAIEQVGAAFHLQDLMTNTLGEETRVADGLRTLGAALETLVLRPSGHSLTLEVEASAEDVFLPAHASRSLGQLVVEAVINAAKHAFPAVRGGRVTIRLSQATASITCVVVDDGVGCRGVTGRTGSRGMILSDALARQAGGSYAWVSGEVGTEVRIAWPVGPADTLNPA